MKIRFGFNYRKLKAFVRRHHLKDWFWGMIVAGVMLMVYGIVGTMEYNNLGY